MKHRSELCSIYQSFVRMVHTQFSTPIRVFRSDSGGEYLCHTRFSKEQNQANHMCAQEVHTYARMKKYQKQCYYITYT
jgi:hypothetical protein